MLNFNTTIQNFINTQQTTTNSTKQFTEYNSKKKLLSSNVLSSNVNNYITQLKNTFTFYVHNSLQYVVIVMYYSTTKQYSFLVLNTNTLQLAQTTSVKIAKQSVLQLVQQNTTNSTTSTNSTKKTTK